MLHEISENSRQRALKSSDIFLISYVSLSEVAYTQQPSGAWKRSAFSLILCTQRAHRSVFEATVDSLLFRIKLDTKW